MDEALVDLMSVGQLRADLKAGTPPNGLSIGAVSVPQQRRPHE